MLHFKDRQKLTAGAVVLSLFAASVPARAADYAPIDCGKASSGTERAICRSYPLGQAESAHGDIVRRRDVAGCDGATWRYRRCAAKMDDNACIARAYQSRIAALSSALDAIASRGPF
jgi:uncharacterized protein